MVVTLVSALIGSMAMIAAALFGASNIVLALIYVLNAVPILVLVLRAMLAHDAEEALWNCEFDGNLSQLSEQANLCKQSLCGPVLVVSNSCLVNRAPN